MDLNRFLQVKIGERFFLIPGDAVHKVVEINSEELYNSPYGPSYLTHLFLFQKEIIPLFNLESDEKKYEQKKVIIVIIKKLLYFFGIKVDMVLKFAEIEPELIDGALAIEHPFAKKALEYNGAECYLLDTDVLLRKE